MLKQPHMIVKLSFVHSRSPIDMNTSQTFKLSSYPRTKLRYCYIHTNLHYTHARIPKSSKDIIRYSKLIVRSSAELLGSLRPLLHLLYLKEGTLKNQSRKSKKTYLLLVQQIVRIMVRISVLFCSDSFCLPSTVFAAVGARESRSAGMRKCHTRRASPVREHRYRDWLPPLTMTT